MLTGYILGPLSLAAADVALTSNYGNGKRLPAAYLRVGHPTAWFHLVGIQAPVLEFLFKEGATDVCWVVKFASSVIVEDLTKDPWMPVEKVFIEHRVIVAQGLGEPRQPGRRDLFECGFVGFVAYTATVEDAAIIYIHLELLGKAHIA